MLAPLLGSCDSCRRSEAGVRADEERDCSVVIVSRAEARLSVEGPPSALWKAEAALGTTPSARLWSSLSTRRRTP